MKNDRKLAREPMADACPQPLVLGVRESQRDGVPLWRWSAAGICRNRRQRPDQGDRVDVCSGSGAGVRERRHRQLPAPRATNVATPGPPMCVGSA